MPFGKGIRADRRHDDEKETGTEKILRLSKISRICWKDGGKYDTMITIKLPEAEGRYYEYTVFFDAQKRSRICV